MASHLAPCPSCERHVRANEAQCPFCGGEITSAPEPPPAPPGRLGRAAYMAFRAAIAGTMVTASAGMVGCSDSRTPNRDAGTEVDAGRDAGAIAPPYGAPAYGAPPPDGG